MFASVLLLPTRRLVHRAQAHQDGEEFLFFQGPSPLTKVQKNVPSFFSGDNFKDLKIVPALIGVS